MPQTHCPPFPRAKHTASPRADRGRRHKPLCSYSMKTPGWHTLSFKLQVAETIIKHCMMTAMATSGAGHCSCRCIKCRSGRRVVYLEGQRLHCVVLGPVSPSVPTQIDVPRRRQQCPEPLQHTTWYETYFIRILYFIVFVYLHYR